MSTEFLFLTGSLFFTIAVLYSMVGHAGASGYLAIMALLSFTPDSIKPTSLVLNIAVALIASIKFISSGYFDRHIFFSFILTSIPASFFGGSIHLNQHIFKLIAGAFLLLSALSLVFRLFTKSERNKEERDFPVWAGLIVGTLIGFFSGLIGVGGGIFLSPILIFFRWTSVKNVSGISALFILVNSLAGLAGYTSSLQKTDTHIFYWIPIVIAGGFIGSWLGTKKLNNQAILIFLAIVLFSAGLKFVAF